MNPTKKRQTDENFPTAADVGLAGAFPAPARVSGFIFDMHPCHCRANRCAACGRFVGETFTGFSRDRMSARGPLFCERCVTAAPRRGRAHHERY